MFEPKILNLTQHPSTKEQRDQGVYDLEGENLLKLKRRLTFDMIPTGANLEDAAMMIAHIANEESVPYAMIGGAPFFMSALEQALLAQEIVPIYSFSKRESVEEAQSDGTIKKVNIFKHINFVYPFGRLEDQCWCNCDYMFEKGGCKEVKEEYVTKEVDYSSLKEPKEINDNFLIKVTAGGFKRMSSPEEIESMSNDELWAVYSGMNIEEEYSDAIFFEIERDARDFISRLYGIWDLYYLPSKVKNPIEWEHKLQIIATYENGNEIETRIRKNDD